MYILLALAFFLLTQAVLAQQPTPILPDPKLTPSDTFDVTPITLTRYFYYLIGGLHIG